MNDYIWLVTVTDKVLIFDKVDRPSDWDEKAIKQPYGELNGTYLGWKEFESNYFYLRRDRKMPENCGMSWTKWRTSQSPENLGDSKFPYDTGYALEPNTFYEYEGNLYTLGCNFH
jgi:hypothetical protein